jgi:hypothetical protein
MDIRGRDSIKSLKTLVYKIDKRIIKNATCLFPEITITEGIPGGNYDNKKN